MAKKKTGNLAARMMSQSKYSDPKLYDKNGRQIPFPKPQKKSEKKK